MEATLSLALLHQRVVAVAMRLPPLLRREVVGRAVVRHLTLLALFLVDQEQRHKVTQEVA
jgi:hypothetical protein